MHPLGTTSTGQHVLLPKVFRQTHLSMLVACQVLMAVLIRNVAVCLGVFGMHDTRPLLLQGVVLVQQASFGTDAVRQPDEFMLVAQSKHIACRC